MFEFEKKPLFVTFKHRLNLSEQDSVEILVELDKHEFIQDIGFQVKLTKIVDAAKVQQLKYQFNDFCEQIHGDNIHELSVFEWPEELEGDDELVFNTFFNLPKLVFKKGLNQYLGLEHDVASLKSVDKNDLICRCFGIYGTEIKKFVKENPKTTYLNTSAKLLCGSACGHCADDVKLVIRNCQLEKYVHQGKLQFELLVSLGEFFIKNYPQLEVLDLFRGQVFIKAKSGNLPQISQIEEQIKRELNLDIRVTSLT